MAMGPDAAENTVGDCKAYVEFTSWLIDRLEMTPFKILPASGILPPPGLASEYRENTYLNIMGQMIKDGIICINHASLSWKSTIRLVPSCILDNWRIKNQSSNWPEQAFTKKVWTDDIRDAVGDISGYLAFRSREERDLQRDSAPSDPHIRSACQSDSKQKGALSTKRDRELAFSARPDMVGGSANFGASTQLLGEKPQDSSFDSGPVQKKARLDDSKELVGQSVSFGLGVGSSMNSQYIDPFAPSRQDVHESSTTPDKLDTSLKNLIEHPEFVQKLKEFRQEYPSARIELRQTSMGVEIICEDCPSKKFLISKQGGSGWANLRQHLESNRHLRRLTPVSAPSASAQQGPRLKSTRLAALNVHNPVPAGPALALSSAPSADKDTPTIHQHNRLDADHAKLSHEHKALKTDVSTLQKTTQELSDTITTVYRKQSGIENKILNLRHNTDDFIPKSQAAHIAIKDTIGRIQLQLLAKSQIITRLEKTSVGQDALLTSQTKLLTCLHGDIEALKKDLTVLRNGGGLTLSQLNRLEETVDGISKALLAHTADKQSTHFIKQIEERLDGFVTKTETALADVEAKLVKATETNENDRVAMQKEFSTQKIETKKIVEMKQPANKAYDTNEKLQALQFAFQEEQEFAREASHQNDVALKSVLNSADEDVVGLRKELWLERDANKAQRASYEHQIETLTNEKVKAANTIQVRNDVALKDMADRIKSLEDTNVALVGLLDRVQKLESAVAGDDTIVVDHPGAATMGTRKTSVTKDTVAKCRDYGA